MCTILELPGGPKAGPDAYRVCIDGPDGFTGRIRPGNLVALDVSIERQPPANEHIRAAEAQASAAASVGELQITADLGRFMRLLGAVDAQEQAIRMIGRAGPRSEVLLLGFTFDRDDIWSALVDAHARGARTKVGLDRRMTLSGKTANQLGCAARLRDAGVEVRLINGDPLEPEYRLVGREDALRGRESMLGIQHAKCVLVDDLLLIGSVNWTTSSRCNSEFSALLHLNDHGKQEVGKLYDTWRRGQPFGASGLGTADDDSGSDTSETDEEYRRKKRRRKQSRIQRSK